MLLDKIKSQFRIRTHFDKLSRNTYDAHASQLLHNLFPEGTILPFTPFSLNPNTILHIINEIQVNKRRSILEFGSGLSTIVLAKFIKLNKIPAIIISIEDDKSWSEIISVELLKHDCADVVQLHWIPLKEVNQQTWYDKSIVNNVIQNHKIDLLVVDGPSARFGPRTRFPALETTYKNLNENFIIFLDDTRRNGEAEILEDWHLFLSKNNIENKKTKLSCKTYGTLTGGIGFSAEPLRH